MRSIGRYKKIGIEDRYLLRFNTFFNSAILSLTVRNFQARIKPVFVKSLIVISDYNEEQSLQRLVGQRWISRQNNKLRVDLNFIAIRYIQYFWEFYFKFKLKQSHSPQDANINRILRTLKKCSQDTYSKFLNRRRFFFP